MNVPQVCLLLPTGQTFTGALVARWPRYRVVLADGSVAHIRRRAVLAVVHEPEQEGAKP